MKKLFLALTILFLVLVFLHFFSSRPLWLDEQYVFESIRDFSYDQIFGPLKNGQAFPRVQLVVVKWLGEVFGHHVAALRLFSLLSMLAAFFLWKSLYQKVLPPAMALLATATFATSYSMSYYAAELKPYATDVLAIGLVVWFVMGQVRWKTVSPSAKDYAICSLLPCLMLFSYTSILGIWIGIYNFLRMLRKNPQVKNLLFCYSVMTAFSFWMLWTFDVRFTQQVQGLFNYWESYFLCSDSVGCLMETFWEGMRRLAAKWYGKEEFFLRWASFLIPFFLYGLIWHGLRRWAQERWEVFSLSSLGVVLFLQLFALGLLRKYPFTGDRITLFLAPFIFYWIVKAMEDLKKVRWLFYFFVISHVVFLVACAAYSLYIYGQLYFLEAPGNT